MPSVFKIYLNGISDSNMIWKSDDVEKDKYGDSILSPKLKKEINKADGFDFMILPSNSHYDSFEKKKTMLFVTRDDKCIFRGRVSEVKTDIFKQRTINCEGDLAFLADTMQSPNKKTDTADAGSTEKKKRETRYYGFDGSSSTSDSKLEMTAENYFRGLIGEHNVQADGYGKGFIIGTINVSGRHDSEKFERTSYQSTSSVISSDLLSVYGGVLQTRYENDKAYIDWLEEFTTTSEQSIRFGLNMIEMDQEAPSDEVWSVLLPVGEDNVTIADVNGGSIYLENSDAITKYGYIVHCHQFNNVKKASDLKRKAEQYLMIHGLIFPDNLIVKAIDLQLIGESDAPLELGEKIKVVSEPHNLDTTMSCIAMELDIFNPENNSYTIGTIMPPDKEKRKDSLSSKQSESNSSHSRGIGNNANKIGKLNEDINVNANNINVNAKNIAVNALNIAVNAENIAIVAKNIAIAADTIDIKTRQLSIEFGEKTDDMYGYIHASAEGIKTFFANNITGLSSYISQTAGEISAGVQNAAGTLSSKITLTEESLTTEFNKKLYGPNQDGTGGLVADYSSKITTSARNLTAEFNETLYGNKGTLLNPTGGLVQDYKSKIEASANALTSTFDKTLYGYDEASDEYGTIDNPKEGSIIYHYKSEIQQSAEGIHTYVEGELYGSGGSKENPQEHSIMSEINQNARQINLRVKKEDLISEINQTADSVTIRASKIALDGVVLTDHLTSTYATIASLNTTNANITNLTSGSTKATHLKATTLSADTLQVYRNAGAASEYQIYYPSMIKRGGSSYYSNYVLSTNSSGELDLSHSHSVSTGSDGTITIGGAVSTDATNRSFRIADTKTYKDGVSAARIEGINSVTVRAVGYDTVSYPSSYVSYNSSSNAYDVKVRAVASNNSFLQNSLSIDATEARNSVSVSSVTVGNISATNDDDDQLDCANMAVTVKLSTGKSETKNLSEVPMWQVYNAGKDYVKVVSWSIGDIYATEDSGDGRYDCAHMTIGASLNNGKTYQQEYNTVLMWPVYDAGRRDAVNKKDVYVKDVFVFSDGSAVVDIAIYVGGYEYSRGFNVNAADVHDSHT